MGSLGVTKAEIFFLNFFPRATLAPSASNLYYRWCLEYSYTYLIKVYLYMYFIKVYLYMYLIKVYLYMNILEGILDTAKT